MTQAYNIKVYTLPYPGVPEKEEGGGGGEGYIPRGFEGKRYSRQITGVFIL